MVNNFKLQNLSIKEDVFVSCHIGEDYIDKEINGNGNQSTHHEFQTINNTTDDLTSSAAGSTRR
jgi:hypothetical protein